MTEPKTPASLAAKKIVYACPVDHANSIIFITSWFYSREAHTSLLLVPDFSEPVEAYAKLSSQLAGQGIHVYLYNQREKPTATRQTDLLQVAAWIRHQEGGIPPVLISKGLGALLCLHFAVAYPKFCRGLFCINPISRAQFLFPGHRELLLFFAELLPHFRVPAYLNCLRTEGQQKSNSIVFQILLDFLPSLLAKKNQIQLASQLHPIRIHNGSDAEEPLEFFRAEVVSWIANTFPPIKK